MGLGQRGVVIFLQAAFLHAAYGKAIPESEDDNDAAVNMMSMGTGTMATGMTMDMEPGMDMSMKMYFHISNHATILFETWHTMTSQDIIIASIGAGIAACLYEGFKVGRELLFIYKQTPTAQDRQIYPMNGSTNKGFHDDDDDMNRNNHNNKNAIRYDSGRVDDGCLNPKIAMCSGWHWLQAFLHVIQVFLSYCLMMIFMTFNAWLCIAVCVGAGIGYLLFGWMRRALTDNNDHCL